MELATNATDKQPIQPSNISYLATCTNAQEEISISCYDHEIPPYVEAELVRLYNNLFSSIVQFKLYGNIEHASAYVERSSGVIKNVFLYNFDHSIIHVMNEGIRIEQPEMRRFCQYIFEKYPSVDVITFHAIQTDISRLPFPYQRINFLEDIVLTLPDSAEEYFSSLGKSTRKTIKGYMNKFKRNFPSFRLTVFIKEQVSEKHIQEIINFKSARMSKVNKVSAFDQEATRRIIALSKECGMVCLATIDGRICAGSISYRMGDNYFMHVSSHDSSYDEFRLGIIYCYLTICECINLGGKECHFLWGRQEYKYRLLGVKRDLDNFLVYRSRMHFLMNIDLASIAMLKGAIRKTSLWLHAIKHQDSVSSRIISVILGLWRSIMRQKPDFSVDDI